MAAVYPPGLPFFVVDAERQVADDQERTAMDVGPAKVRRRSAARPGSYSAQMPPITPAQLDTFEAFYASTLEGGVLPFDATDPTDCTEKTFRFVGGYAVRRVGGRRRVTATLEILP